MPFDGEHDWASGRDGVLPLLLQWGCVQGCSTLHHPTRRGDSPECPANTSQCPHKGGCHGYDCGAHYREEAPKQVPWLGKVLHPSRPVVAAGEIPPLSRGPRQRPCSQSMGEGLVWIPQTEEPSVSTTQLAPLTYQRVGDCLMSNMATWFCQSNGLSSKESATRGGFQLRHLECGSTYGAYCSDHEHQPHCKRWSNGGNYMDTMTTSVGTVTLSGPEQEASTQGLQYWMSQTLCKKQPENCLWVVRWTAYLFWVGKGTDDHLWVERVECQWVVTMLSINF